MMLESSGFIDRMFADQEARAETSDRLVHNADLSHYGHVESSAADVVSGTMGVERTRTWAVVDGEHVGSEDSPVLPMRETYTDGMAPGQPEIGSLEHSYAELPDGRLVLERVVSEFKGGDMQGTQEIVRQFDMKTGRTQQERLVIDGKLQTERTYADPEDYEGGSMVTDLHYRPDGTFDKRVVLFRRPNEGWQRHESHYDRRGKETSKPWTHSLTGPEPLQGPPQPVGFVKPARMSPDRRSL